MLNRKVDGQREIEMLRFPENDKAGGATLELQQILSVVRRRRAVVILSVILSVMCGLGYAITATPLYTASVGLLIDSRRNQDQLSTSIADSNFDTSAIDSQVEVLKSNNVADVVIKTLNLEQDAEFQNPKAGPWQDAVSRLTALIDVRRWFGGKGFTDEEIKQQLHRETIRKLTDYLDVRRVGRTYVLQINYTSWNRYKAQSIANAYADAYFNEQLNAKFDETRRASGWLQDRLVELKARSLSSDLAVQQFKAKKGLVSVGDDKYVGDQQISELTSQISTAHGETAKAEARLQQINAVIASGNVDAAVTDSLVSSLVTDLRSKYLKASKTQAELSAKLGANHYQVLSLKNEMMQYEQQIFNELRRIAETYASDLTVARNREKTLNETMSSLIGQQVISNETMVQLRELEREAETYKTLYESFLQRYQDALQRQSFPASEARVIGSAELPLVPSYPKKSLIAAIATFIGLFLGGGIAFLKEFQDRVFRVGQQVRDDLGLNLIGIIDKVADRQIRLENESPKANELQISRSILRQVIDAPLSSFAETLRAAKVDADLSIAKRIGAKVIGVISVLPGEGKTTIAKNFASVLALQGSRTLLLDGDIRNPGLSKRVARHAAIGLTDVLRGNTALDTTILSEPQTGLHMLPMGTKKRLNNNAELISSSAMTSLLSDLRSKYDYIIVDLPPIGPVNDTRASAHLFDGFILVVEWGNTPRSVVSASMQASSVVYEKCLGVILSKVDMRKFRTYADFSSKDYYHDMYGDYYIDAAK